MKNQELEDFIKKYLYLHNHKKSATDLLWFKFNEVFDDLLKRFDRYIEPNDQEQKKLRCLYKSFEISGWHCTPYSGYLFIDITTKELGLLLTGYEYDDEEQDKLMKRWNLFMQKAYKKDSNLKPYKWVNANIGYFKFIEGLGHSFDPDKVPEFNNTFYWGYTFPLEISSINSMQKSTANGLKKLMKAFVLRKDVIYHNT